MLGTTQSQGVCAKWGSEEKQEAGAPVLRDVRS